MKLYPHQELFINTDPDNALVCFGAGTGKTLTAVLWLKSKQGKKLVIVPKRIKEKWKDDLKENNVEADVLTKEEFKKVDIRIYDVIVFDEFHFANSPLFEPNSRSQVTEKIYDWVRYKGKKSRLLGLTATPISSKPANIHTLLTLIGVYIDWKKFREEFYMLTSPPYMKGRYIWQPRRDWRERARELVEKYAWTATMDDIVEEVPEQHEEVIKISLSKNTKDAIEAVKNDPEYESDIAIWYAQHKLEQKDKIKTIKEISADRSKVIVVAKYLEQIKDLEKALSKERKVYTLTGQTKDPEQVIKEANADSECYMIIQADVSEGYELPTFNTMIFASQSWRKISDVQMKARIQRINNLKSNWYYWLVSNSFKGYKSKDQQVYDRILKGEDFIIK